MGQRVIPVAVTAEYIGGDGVTLGAAGSHDSVVIEYDFRSAGPMWEPPEGGSLVKYVLWTNPQGNTTNRVDLGVDKIVDGFDGKVYHASPTADAMCVAGWAEMVVVGAVVDNSTTPPTEVLKVKTEPSRFRVLPGSSRAADNEGIAATVADQMEAEIAGVDDRKVNKPMTPLDPNGEAGQILESLGDGKTRWITPTVTTDEQVERVLEQHPDWTTTVQDASISEVKLTPEVLKKIMDGECLRVDLVPIHAYIETDPDSPNFGTRYSSGVGTCVLLRFNGKAYLVDTFTEYQFENYARPYLEGQGITEIECVFLTHYHEDHGEGFPGLCNNFTVKRAVIPPELEWSNQGFIATGSESSRTNVHNIYDGVINALQEHSIPFSYAADGEIDLGDGLKVLVGNTDYAPYYAMTTGPNPNGNDSDQGIYADYNNYSVFYEFEYQGGRVLFPGDANFTALGIMADQIEPCDLLYLPHNNHQNFYNEDFFGKANPSAAVCQDSYIEYNDLVTEYRRNGGSESHFSHVYVWRRQPSRRLYEAGVHIACTNGCPIVAIAGEFGTAVIQEPESTNDAKIMCEMTKTADGSEQTNPNNYNVWCDCMKLPDGTMIQWGSISLLGDLFVTANSELTFVVPFKARFIGDDSSEPRRQGFKTFLTIQSDAAEGDGIYTDMNDIAVFQGRRSTDINTLDTMTVRVVGGPNMVHPRQPLLIDFLAIGKWMV